MKIKKILSVICATFILSASMTSCESTDDNQNSNNTTAKTSTTVTTTTALTEETPTASASSSEVASTSTSKTADAITTTTPTATVSPPVELINIEGEYFINGTEEDENRYSSDYESTYYLVTCYYVYEVDRAWYARMMQMGVLDETNTTFVQVLAYNEHHALTEVSSASSSVRKFVTDYNFSFEFNGDTLTVTTPYETRICSKNYLEPDPRQLW